MEKKIKKGETVQKQIVKFIRNFNPLIFRGRKGLRSLKDLLLDYQDELKKKEHGIINKRTY